MKIEKQITELSAKWYKYVSGDHHKDKDCHFYIQVDYAYGEPPIYSAEHYGYIGDEFEIQTDSYPAAQKALLKAMKEMIKKQEGWVKEVLDKPDDYDNEQRWRAKLYWKLFK